MENYYNETERTGENRPFENIPTVNNDPPAENAAQSENEPAQEQQWSYTPNFILQPQPVHTAEEPQPEAAPEQAPLYHAESAKPRKKKAGIALLMVLCVLFSGVAGFAGGWAAGKLNQPAAAVPQIPESTPIRENIIPQISTEDGLSYAELAAAVSPTVVQITTEYTVENFWMQQTSTGAGSGVIITADGTVVTNHHVVEDATRVKVILSTGDEYDAKLVASDAQTDIAVLKIEAVDLPFASVGNSNELVVGQEVIAVGNPLGKLGGTVTNGIISALERQITVDDYTMTLLQTNTAINPGNSGGGLFDASGRLIGIVNAKYSQSGVEGLGFAIPINTAMKSAQDLIDVGAGHSGPADRVPVPRQQAGCVCVLRIRRQQRRTGSFPHRRPYCIGGRYGRVQHRRGQGHFQ